MNIQFEPIYDFEAQTWAVVALNEEVANQAFSNISGKLAVLCVAVPDARWCYSYAEAASFFRNRK